MPSFKSAFAFCVLLLLTLIPCESVIAQSEEPKIEVGFQFSGIGRGTGYRPDQATNIGGGSRLTFNLTRYLALEGEMNYFPSVSVNNLRRIQGQFGVKSGLRFDRFGLFGKVRPGFIDTRYNGFRRACPEEDICPAIAIPFTVDDTGFSLDVGGVVEFYSSKRVTVRLDVGDTIINHREPPIPVDSEFALPGRKIATHNLQLGAGVGFRF